MRLTEKKRLGAEFLFPLMLFLLFTLSALALVLLSARVYRDIVDSSAMSDPSATALSYLCQKVQQSGGSVSLGEFDGCQALCLRQEHEGQAYDTYIYYHEGQLKELFRKAGAPVGAGSGRALFALSGFSMEWFAEDLLRFTCLDYRGEPVSALVAVRSVP